MLGSDISMGTENESKKSSYSQLYVELKGYVESYAGGLAALSSKICVSKPTLWRWVNFKNSGPPNPYHVLSLIKFVTKKNTLLDMVNTVGGDIATYLTKSFPADLESPPIDLGMDINDLLEDFYCYLIYLLCGTDKKMTREDVKIAVGTYSLEKLGLSIEDSDLSKDMLMQLGQVADLKIDKLILNQILKEDNGYLMRIGQTGKIKVSLTKKHLPKLFTFFKEKNMHKKGNFMYAYQESVPRDTILKVIDIQYEAFMNCYRLMEKTKCEDGEIYILSSFFESLNFR